MAAQSVIKNWSFNTNLFHFSDGSVWYNMQNRRFIIPFLMKQTVTIILFVCFFCDIQAQKHDAVWLAGAPGFEQFTLDFRNIRPIIDTSASDAIGGSGETSLSISNYQGSNTVFSHGCYVALLAIPGNSTQINQDDYWCEFGSGSIAVPHGIFGIPMPGDSNKVVLFSSEFILPFDHPNLIVYDCFYRNVYSHQIDLNNCCTDIVQDVKIAEGCLQKPAACKHANGRDWWIVLGDNQTNKFTRWLLTPNGLEEKEPQFTENPTINNDSLGGFTTTDVAYFSQQGDKYVIYSQKKGLYLFDFDRCTGLLSNPRLVYKPTVYATGSGFSPSGRYLYCNIDLHKAICQFDTEVSDIPASKVVVGMYDGFIDSVFGSQVGFGGMVQGYDGKIYLSSFSAAYYHTIDYPDRPGTTCGFRQRAFQTPSPTTFSIYYPNYRLGPIDGSGCDTVGLDNRPLAIFRYAVDDTLAPLAVTFTDASAYEPTQWYWDFGDGTTSTLTNPEHTILHRAPILYASWYPMPMPLIPCARPCRWAPAARPTCPYFHKWALVLIPQPTTCG